MFKIGKVERGQNYIDSIMNDMSEHATKAKEDIEQRWEHSLSTKRKDQETINLDKRKDLELEKIRYINTQVNARLRKLHKRFPNFRKVEQIYHDLINTSETPIKNIKEALATLMWITQRCDEMTQQSEIKIKHAKTHQTIGFIMKKHLGRVNSLFSKHKSLFDTLESSRKFMESLPVFKDMYTISIAGFPNVGKSTLMRSLSGSEVEVQNYPFTTKGLMFGYVTHNNEKAIQLIDTPGMLGRSKNNAIEKKAAIVLENYCNTIIFVLDLTLSCGYSIEEQLALLKKVKASGKEVLLYLSKTDIYDEEDEELYEEIKPKIKKLLTFRDSESLLQKCVDLHLQREKAFNPSKIKVIK